MRSVRILFGLLFALAGSYLVVAAHQKYGGSSEPIRSALLKQSSALVTAVDHAFFEAEQRAQEIILRNLRKDPATATILSHWDSPRVILFGDEKIKASDFLLDAQLLRALEAHRKGSAPYATYSRNGTQFIFVKGDAQNQPFVAAFLEDALFSGLGVGEAMRVWIASSSGELLFHSVNRLIGSQVPNLRPVASGAEMIANGDSRNLVSSYTGFEGGEALGSWSVLPKRNLIVGTEWAGNFGRDSSIDVPFFIGAGLIGLGFFVLGLALRRRKRKLPERFQFDPARLDDDVIEYLEENRRATEEAVTYAQQKDAEIRDLEARVYHFTANQNELEWRLSCYETLFEQATSGAPPKQILHGLAEVIARRTLGVPVVQYRFSPTSYSLVPEHLAGGESLSDDAREFLSESRIFIGNFRMVGGLNEVESFKNWNRSREKHMGQGSDPLVLPLESGDAVRGALLIMLPKGTNENGELSDVVAFFRGMIQMGAWLCDTKRHLLQLSDANRVSGEAMAGSSNHIGNTAPEAQA